MEHRRVVTSFLTHRGRLLLLRRSPAVRTYAGRWAGVSGSIEHTTPRLQALDEIREETGLGPGDLALVHEGEPLEVEDVTLDVRWTIHPFRWEVLDPAKVRLDWEHTEARWMRPHEMAELETVPELERTWKRVASPSSSS